MLIVSKLFRVGGTRVELGKGKDARRYHFRPTDRNAKLDDAEVEHVCDIDNAEDIGTLLAIKEGYEVHASEINKKAAKTAVAVAEKQHADTEKAEAEAKAAALAGAGPQPPAPQKPYTSMNKPELLKAIAERTGKQPHSSTARGKLVEQLEKLDKKAPA